MVFDQSSNYEKDFTLDQLNIAEEILAKSDEEILESENRVNIVKVLDFMKSRYPNTDLYKFLAEKYSRLEKKFSFKNKYGLLDTCPSITVGTNSYKVEVISSEGDKLSLKISNIFETLIVKDIPKNQKAIDDLIKSLMIDENFGKTGYYSGEGVVKSYNEIFSLDRDGLTDLIGSIASNDPAPELGFEKGFVPSPDGLGSIVPKSDKPIKPKPIKHKNPVQKPKPIALKKLDNTILNSKLSGVFQPIKEIDFLKLGEYSGIDRKDINELKADYRSSGLELDISENGVFKEINSKKYELLGKINGLGVDIVVAKDTKGNLYAFKYTGDKLDYYGNIESNKIVLYSELGEKIKSNDIRFAAQNIAFLELALELVTKDVKIKVHKASAPVETKEDTSSSLKDKITKSCNDLMNIDENKYKLEKKKYLTTIFDNIVALGKLVSLDRNDVLLSYSDSDKSKLLRLGIDIDSDEVQRMIRNSTILIEKKISKINLPYGFLLKSIEKEISTL